MWLFICMCIFFITAFFICLKLDKIQNRRENIKFLLKKSLPILNDSGIKYWVDFGTLLGLKRDGDIILGDNDADLPLDSSQDKILLEKVMKKIGAEYKTWGAYQLHSNNSDGGHIDFYIADLNEGIFNIPDNGNIPYDLVKDLEKDSMVIDDTSVEYLRPKRWMDVLEYRYGKNWVVPLRKWYTLYS